MNWLLITVLVILLFFILRGYNRGFLKIVFSLFSIIVVFAIVTWANPYISSFIEKNTDIYSTIEERCESSIKEKLESNVEESVSTDKNEEEQVEESASDSDNNKSEVDRTSDTEETEVLSGLPTGLQKWLTETVAGTASELVEESGICEKLASQMAHFIVNGISFLIALIFAGIIMHFIIGILDLVSKIPVLKGANKILGAVAGAIQGLLIVWIAFYIVTLCYSSGFGVYLLGMIKSSIVLSTLYNNNLLIMLTMLFL